MKSDETVLRSIVDAAVEVHQVLGGPGLLENIYESALCHELSLRGLKYQRQHPVPVIYKERFVREPLYIDLLIENQIVVEIKATEKDFAYYATQLLTHLRFLKMHRGLLINFGKLSLRETGITHVTC